MLQIPDDEMAEALNNLYPTEGSLFRDCFCPVTKLVCAEFKGNCKKPRNADSPPERMLPVYSQIGRFALEPAPELFLSGALAALPRPPAFMNKHCSCCLFDGRHALPQCRQPARLTNREFEKSA
jgi:hypothetical protein